MEGYIQQALQELKHKLTSNKQQYAPSRVTWPDYRAKVQYAHANAGEPINGTCIRRIEQIIGKFLYYARAIYTTMRHALSSISTQTKNATTNTEAAAQYLMDYAYHNPDAEVMFRASDMILACNSDALY